MPRNALPPALQKRVQMLENDNTMAYHTLPMVLRYDVQLQRGYLPTWQSKGVAQMNTLLHMHKIRLL